MPQSSHSEWAASGGRLLDGEASSDAVPVLDLGVVPYQPLVTLQQHLREAVADGRLGGVLLLLEHEPVITLGTRGGPDDLLPTAERRLAGLPVVRTERGGAATMHAPGQLVSYPVLRIPGRNLRAFVHGLEQTLIFLLAAYGVTAERRAGAPGLYSQGAKIASIGLRCHRWVSSHGTSLNVSNDLHLFDSIVSCGEADLRQTSIAALTGATPPMQDVKKTYSEMFSEVFKSDLGTLTPIGHEEVLKLLGLA
jgi:lipoyl(octanoyl) transferase